MSKTLFFLAIVAAASVLSAGCGGDAAVTPDAGCTPKTQQVACTDAGKNCGNVDDGCGATVFCGGCTGGQTCSGGGTANVCGRNTGNDAGPTTTDGGGQPLTGKVGSACTDSSECTGTNAFCIYGFCTRVCGTGAGNVTNCNAVGVSDPNGVAGGVYSCSVLGNLFSNLCLPNGSGAACTTDGGACPRAGELCISGKCQYPRAGSTSAPRLDMKCHRDADCKPNESCAVFGNMESDNVRSEGLCVYNGDGDSRRLPGGAACSDDSECGSTRCTSAGTCLHVCVADGDCVANHKCYAVPLTGSALEEFPSEFLGLCIPWKGSRTACTANASCPTGEACSVFQQFTSMDLDVEVKGACATFTNPTATGTVGARCTANSGCKSGSCSVNPFNGLGYCTAVCLGGDADCGGGTSCRSLVFDGRDPATTEDDLRAGFCVQTGLGAPCTVDLACKSCSSDAQCNPSQGVTCVDGLCRDPFLRCGDPCRTGCTVGGPSNGGCPTRTTCTEQRLTQTSSAFYCKNTDGTCVRADLAQVLAYEHGRCGDSESASPQQDLCYYSGRSTRAGGGDFFMCGSACPTGGAACGTIPTLDGGTIATACRPVYEFGVNVADGGTIGGFALSSQQCAPDSAFRGQARDGGAPVADGGTPATDGGAAATDGGATATDGGAAADGG